MKNPPFIPPLKGWAFPAVSRKKEAPKKFGAFKDFLELLVENAEHLGN